MSTPHLDPARPGFPPQPTLPTQQPVFTQPLPPSPSLTQAPPPAPAPAAVPWSLGDAVFWSVNGWDETRPFHGELVFSNEHQTVLAVVPVEPEAMRSLNDITATVLAAQYAAVGYNPDDDDYDDDSVAGTPDTDGRKYIQRDLLGIPISMSINPKALTVLGIAAGVLVIAAAFISITR